MIQSAVKLQGYYRKRGQLISYEDAINICKKNPFLMPIKGNKDKFKSKSEEEVKVIMAKMEKEAKEKEDE